MTNVSLSDQVADWMLMLKTPGSMLEWKLFCIFLERQDLIFGETKLDVEQSFNFRIVPLKLTILSTSVNLH